MTSKADGSLTEWLFEVEICKKMAARSSTPESRTRWLNLAAGWQALAESRYTPADEREASVCCDITGEKHPRSVD